MSATPAAAAPHAKGKLGEFTPDPHQRVNAYKKVQGSLGTQDRIALVITGAIGTMYAVYVFAAVLAGWMLWQILAGKAAFDPYPFAFLLFLGNIVQLLLMPLIMVGQNLQNRHAEVRADAEYNTVGKMFHDTEAVMKHLDLQDAELLRQTRLLTALVESLVPADQRAAILAGSEPATPASAA